MAEQLEIAKVDNDGIQFGGTGPLAGVSVSGDFLRKGGFAGAIRPGEGSESPSQADATPAFAGRRPSALENQKKGAA